MEMATNVFALLITPQYHGSEQRDARFWYVYFIIESISSSRVHSIVTSLFGPGVREVAGELFPAFIADERNTACP
jgi:hypothetical protein